MREWERERKRKSVRSLYQNPLGVHVVWGDLFNVKWRALIKDTIYFLVLELNPQAYTLINYCIIYLKNIYGLIHFFLSNDHVTDQMFFKHHWSQCTLHCFNCQMPPPPPLARQTFFSGWKALVHLRGDPFTAGQAAAMWNEMFYSRTQCTASLGIDLMT